jgi:hypothetical protein
MSVGDSGARPLPPPPVRTPRPRPRTAAAGIVLAVFSILTLWLTLRSTATTFHLSARTEELRIYTGRGTSTSAISFGRVFLADGDARIPMDSTGVRLADDVTIVLHRVLRDTLAIMLDANPDIGSVGTVHKEERLVRRLGADARFLVPLAGDGSDASFLLSFRARSVEVGDVPGFTTGPRPPLLRSGELTLVDRTLTRVSFEAGSYTLRTGQRLDLPAPGITAAQPGAGVVLVEDDMGMAVDFSVRAPRAVVYTDTVEERLATAAFHRVSRDPVITLAWVLLVALVLAPAGSVIADRMKTRTETLLKRP